jgi:DNA polymerase elongation subunit (family B)
MDECNLDCSKYNKNVEEVFYMNGTDNEEWQVFTDKENDSNACESSERYKHGKYDEIKVLERHEYNLGKTKKKFKNTETSCKCMLCGHSIIHIFQIYNKKYGIYLNVGSECVKLRNGNNIKNIRKHKKLERERLQRERLQRECLEQEQEQERLERERLEQEQIESKQLKIERKNLNVVYGQYRNIKRHLSEESCIEEKYMYVQMIEWWANDINPEMEEDDEDDKYEDNKRFTIFGFGSTKQGKSVAIKINDFKPFFYVKVPEQWLKNNALTQRSKDRMREFLDTIKGKVFKKYKEGGIININYIKAKSLFNYCGDNKSIFLKMTCRNVQAMQSFVSVIRKNTFDIQGMNGQYFELFENNILPLLRFFHIHNISPAHWIKIHQSKIEILNEDERLTDCQIEISVDYRDVLNANDYMNPVAPMVYVGYDIESTSSHGDFPLCVKNYSKLSNDITDAYMYFKDIRFKLDEYKFINDVIEYAFNDYNVGTNIKYIKLKREISENSSEMNTIINNVSKILNDEVEKLIDENILETIEGIDIYNIYSTHLVDSISQYIPEIDYQDKFTTNLQFYVKRMLNEFKRLYSNKINMFYNKTTRYETIKLMVKNSFNPSFNSITINNVFTKNNKKPKMNDIRMVSTDMLLNCQDCHMEIQNKKAFNEMRKMNSKLRVSDYSFQKRDDYILNMTGIMDNKFPEIRGDETIQIGTVFQRYGEAHPFLKHMIVLDTCDSITNHDTIYDEHKDIEIQRKVLLKEMKNKYPECKNMMEDDIKNMMDGLSEELKQELQSGITEREREKQMKEDTAEVIVESYKTEKEVLLAWTRLIKQLDPDIISGYNIFGFDHEFMYRRAVELGCEDEFLEIARFKYKLAEYMEEDLNSSGMGDNKLNNMKMYGRINVDLLKRVQGDFKFDTYKLDYVCYRILNKRKNDLPPQQIFIKQRGNSGDRCIIARYCFIDCVLCNRLMDKMQIIAKNISMANVCSVPLSFLFFRGQGIKLLSLVSKECRQLGYLVPFVKKEEGDEMEKEGFEGAVVLSATKGNHVIPIPVADYNSLYPSCMIASNLSPDTFVVIGGKYDNMEGVEYLDVEYTNYIYVDDYTADGKLKKNKKKVINKEQPVVRCRYVQYKDGEKGVIPKILQKLLKSRKDTRTIQAKFQEGSFEWAIKELEQLAYKVTANSLYGQLGAPTSPIYFVEVAASVTAEGRKNLEFARDYIQEHYEGSNVIYGDSITGSTPIMIKRAGILKTPMVKDLLRMFDMNEKGYKSYSSFKLDEKDLYDKKYADMEKYKIKIWTKNGWRQMRKLIRHRTYKDIYRIITKKGFVDVTQDHSLINEKGDYIKPEQCEIGKTKLLVNKMNGKEMLNYYEGLSKSDYGKLKDFDFQIIDKMRFHRIETIVKSIHDSRKERSIIFISNNMSCSKMDEMKLYVLFINYLLKYYKWNVNYQIYHNPERPQSSIHLKMYYQNILERTVEDDDNLIIDMYKLERDMDKLKYIEVYDIETEDGTFQAGVGDIIVKNTDSIFIKFKNADMFGRELSGQPAIDRAIELCIEGAQRVSKHLVKPHNLEFEKCIYPFILFTKKRYHGHYYTVAGSDEYYQKSMGIVLKRRDNAQIVKNVFGGAINIIMSELNVNKALSYVEQCIKDIYAGKYPMSDFIITKTLRSTYKNPDSISHKVLADRIKLRDPGNAPRSNDRIGFAYVKIENESKDTLQGDRIETPEYIVEHNLELDYRFYIDRQIYKPLKQLFELDDIEHIKKIDKWITMYDTTKTSKCVDLKKFTGLNLIKLKRAGNI